MNLKPAKLALILFGVAFVVIICAFGVAPNATEMQPDWLSPFTAGRPSWDPYGPGQESTYVPSSPSWDPFGPSAQGTSSLTSENPFSQGLVVRSDVLYPNQIYVQSGGQLTTSAVVNLGQPYTLWLYVTTWGPFALYDRGNLMLSRGFLTPGWYKVNGYAEILEDHSYQFNATSWSNKAILRVNSGGYPTTYSLVGRVIDSHGNGISGALVKISGSEGGSFSTNANSQGYYGMDLPSGTYTVTAELGGYQFTQARGRIWMGTVSVAETMVGYYTGREPSPTYAPYETLSPDGVGWLEGKIENHNGLGLSGITVVVDGFSSATTDYRGNYQVSLNSGWHAVSANDRGYLFQPSSTNVYIRPSKTSRLDFVGRPVLVLGSV